MKYRTGTLSAMGPRAVNEDVIGIWSFGSLLAVGVADGLGGMGGGQRASQIAISMFDKFIRSPNFQVSRPREVALDIHSAILDLQEEQPEFRRMPTTFAAGIFRDSNLDAVHVGDSRIAIARGQGIIRVTKDHSEAQRLLSAGKITKKEFSEYPRKNILESALGIHGKIEIDTSAFHLVAGDKVIFSTDGVHNIVLLRELRQLAENHNDPEFLVSAVDQLVRERGAGDNYSLVVVYVEEPGRD